MSDFDQEWRAQSRRNLESNPPKVLVEFYDGEDINDWHRRRIRIQLYNILKTYEGVNEEYSKALKEFIDVWENKKLYDGAINVEDIEDLMDSTRMMVTREWPLKNFFINLEASLSNILASEGKLMRTPGEEAEKPPKGLTGKKNLAGEVPSMFGPMKDRPEPIGGVEEPESEQNLKPVPTAT
jgi:hypothetical protein